MANTVVQRFTVQARSELRIEIGESEAYVTVTEGTAEIFGAVVQLHRKLRLVHSKIAIFTYDGCSVTLEGMPSESPYVLITPAGLSRRNLLSVGSVGASTSGGDADMPLMKRQWTHTSIHRT